MLSEAVEDYLKAIYTIADGDKPVSASASNCRPTRCRTGIRHPDAQEATAEMKPKLVLYKRHHGVQLTAHGEKIALEVIRHHRLVELFLQEALGMSWDKVDREAEHLEHVVSETLADRMAEVLGHPQFEIPTVIPSPPSQASCPKAAH